MASGTRTFGFDETLIEPRVLPPPPTRHALLVFLLVLAAIMHFGSAGWSDIHDGAEGYYAAAARDMFRANSWAPPSAAGSSAHLPPLIYWLTLASYKALGVTATAARMPVTLAMVLSVALTFLIGERFGGYWRGFTAGLVQLCSLGAFVWGRTLTAEPVFSVALQGAIFCAVCGYQRAQGRRLWFAGTWLCVALACLTKGAYGIIYPAAIFVVLALLFREARLRFRLLVNWRYVVPFLLFIVALRLVGRCDWLPPFGDDNAPLTEHVTVVAFLGRTAACWFPAWLLVVPAVLFGARKIFRPHEFEFADALPICWFAVGFLPLLVFPHRQDYHSMSTWSALALWVACAWHRTPRALQLAGLAFTAAVSTALVAAIALGRFDQWPIVAGHHSMAMLAGIAMVVACAVGAYLAWTDRAELAITAVMLAMVPIGLTVAEATARFGPHFSLAEAARFLQPRLGDTGEVLYEGPANDASSLAFYLDRRPLIFTAGDKEASEQVIAKMSSPTPVFLIIEKERISFWQERLTDRFHIYHQATTCGSHVLINNQP